MKPRRPNYQHCLSQYLAFLLVLLCAPYFSTAQCSDWKITATLTATSVCAANGSFTVTVSGPDAANLSNIQYGIPISASGFSVPLNNTASFSNIPPGTFTVSAVASCGGSMVGKNTTIDVPGSYEPPMLSTSMGRGSISCGAYGIISAYVIGGAPPYSLRITSAPSTYTGPTTFTAPTPSYAINNLPSGSYSIRAVDVCGSGTTTNSVFVTSLPVSSVPLVFSTPMNNGSCNTVTLSKPVIQTNGTGWQGYYNDGSFKVSAQIDNGVSSSTSSVPMDYTPFTIPLNSGKSIKDCYGQNITYTFTPPCGSSFTRTSYIPYPSVTAAIDQNCNVDFGAYVYFSDLICYPVTYSIRNTATGVSYGPYTATTNGAVLPSRYALGAYTISYTTADGYTGSGGFSTTTVSGTPYSVSVINGASGLHNYIEGFKFTSTSSASTRTIELFSGPAGYSFLRSGIGSNPYNVYNNQTPIAPNSQKFIVGTYVWKITDNCGTYYLPITVDSSHLFQYTAGITRTRQECNGMWVVPTGTATNNGNSVPVYFSVLQDGYPMYDIVTGLWPRYALGDSFRVNMPGVYTIVPAASSFNTIYLGLTYPNAYTRTYSFTYTVAPVQVDINRSQGFLCIGGSAGQGQIYATGMGGTPFKSPSTHYNYSLAAKGNGISGPFIASNTTGIFTGFGGNANDVYDVKIEDSCGGFAVQQLKILDLTTTRLISSSAYAACSLNNVQLSAIYLPGATYSWTGPGGFSSTLREPLITSLSAANVGVYKVSITIPGCSQTVSDSTIITVSPNPPKPNISLDCNATPVTIHLTNATSPYKYEWQMGIYIASIGSFFYVTVPPDVNNDKYVYGPGSYKAIAIDSTTGCTSYSDSLLFWTDPNDPLEAVIYSPHLQVCTGDTTILVAQGATRVIGYQWFFNGAPIAGATKSIYNAAVAGRYKVSIETGPCSKDTSDEVVVSIIPYPVATISISAPNICKGSTATLQTGTGTGYQYTWSFNGSTIPGINTSTLNVSSTGSYVVTVANGGCAATSPPVSLTVHNPPVVDLKPAADTVLCKGDALNFTTIANPAYTYKWKYNGSNIPGANSSTYTTNKAGRYSVVVSNAYCPDVTSQEIGVKLLPNEVHLPADTIICTGAFSVPMSVDADFENILWSTGATGSSITGTANGIYWVEARNICGVFSDTMYIRTAVDYKPALPYDTTICNEANETTLSVPALAQNIKWSTGDTVATILVNQPGKYWVYLESPCGNYSDTIRVGFCKPVINSLFPLKDSICIGDCVEFFATVANYPQTYSWSFDGGSPASVTGPSSGTICYNQPGIFPVTLTAFNAGGSAVRTGQIVVVDRPAPRFDDTTIVLSYKSRIELPACAGAMAVDWYKDGELVCGNCATLPVEGREYRSVYHCVVRNISCTDSCTYKLEVTDIPNDVWLPDAFSPNGDGKNDLFRVITDNPNVRVLNLMVYNRWGEQVYKGGKGDKGWDGTYKGQAADVGTYFWSLQYEVIGGQAGLFKKGDIILMR